MRRRLLASVTVLVAVLLLVAVPTVSGKKPGQILDFQSMVGVPKPLTRRPRRRSAASPARACPGSSTRRRATCRPTASSRSRSRAW